MNDTRNAQERLDALLTGLEDEVIRGEGDVGTDVEAMRAEMAALIEAHAGDGRQRGALPKAGDVKARVASAMELLGRRAGISEVGSRRPAAPRVRMAFSGEREPLEAGGCSEPGSTRDRAKGAAEGRES